MIVYIVHSQTEQMMSGLVMHTGLPVAMAYVTPCSVVPRDDLRVPRTARVNFAVYAGLRQVARRRTSLLKARVVSFDEHITNA